MSTGEVREDILLILQSGQRFKHIFLTFKNVTVDKYFLNICGIDSERMHQHTMWLEVQQLFSQYWSLEVYDQGFIRFISSKLFLPDLQIPISYYVFIVNPQVCVFFAPQSLLISCENQCAKQNHSCHTPLKQSQVTKLRQNTQVKDISSSNYLPR